MWKNAATLPSCISRALHASKNILYLSITLSLSLSLFILMAKFCFNEGKQYREGLQRFIVEREPQIHNIG